jgi:hypothetical protein
MFIFDIIITYILVYKQINKQTNKYSHVLYRCLHRNARAFFAAKYGSGGTSPCQIISGILAKKIDTKMYHLILVTDGEISSSEVDKCDEIIQKNNITFGFVSVFIIGTSNTSVQAAFCRKCGSRVFLLKENKPHNEVKPEMQISAEDHALLDEVSKINTYSELKIAYDGLVRALTARMMGTKGDKYVNE